MLLALRCGNGVKAYPSEGELMCSMRSMRKSEGYATEGSISFEACRFSVIAMSIIKLEWPEQARTGFIRGGV